MAFLNETGLTTYDGKIKAFIATSISNNNSFIKDSTNSSIKSAISTTKDTIVTTSDAPAKYAAALVPGAIAMGEGSMCAASTMLIPGGNYSLTITNITSTSITAKVALSSVAQATLLNGKGNFYIALATSSSTAYKDCNFYLVSNCSTSMSGLNLILTVTIDSRTPLDTAKFTTSNTVLRGIFTGFTLGKYSAAVNRGNAFGENSFAANLYASAWGDASAAFNGAFVAPTGTNAFATCTSTVKGVSSLGFGSATIESTADAALGGGFQCSTAASQSVVAGWKNHIKSNANQSVVFGADSETDYKCTFIAGEGHVAAAPHQTLVGKCAFANSSILFAVGDGASKSTPHNAFEVTSSGAKVVGLLETSSISASGQISVGGVSLVANSGKPYIIVGTSSTLNINPNGAIVSGVLHTINPYKNDNDEDVAPSEFIVSGVSNTIGHKGVLVTGAYNTTSRDHQVLFGTGTDVSNNPFIAVGNGNRNTPRNVFSVDSTGTYGLAVNSTGTLACIELASRDRLDAHINSDAPLHKGTGNHSVRSAHATEAPNYGAMALGMWSRTLADNAVTFNNQTAAFHASASVFGYKTCSSSQSQLVCGSGTGAIVLKDSNEALSKDNISGLKYTTDNVLFRVACGANTDGIGVSEHGYAYVGMKDVDSQGLFKFEISESYTSDTANANTIYFVLE